MATRTATQRQRILHRLERGDSINPLQALELYGCMRLGGRVHELRQQGHKIETSMVRVKTRDGRGALVIRIRWRGDVRDGRNQNRARFGAAGAVSGRGPAAPRPGGACPSA